MPNRRPSSMKRPASRQPRQPRNSCLGLVVRMIILVMLLVAVVFILRPDLFQPIGQGVSKQVGVQERIEEQAQQALPSAVAALPTGEVTLTQEDANSYLAANIASLAPLEQVTVQFVPDQLQADLVAYGTESRITCGLTAQDGRIAVIDPHLEGALSMAVSIDELSSVLERQINEQLVTQGQSVRDVRIEEGQIVVTIENAE